VTIIKDTGIGIEDSENCFLEKGEDRIKGLKIAKALCE
jgi:hypothetical protein